MIYYLLSYRNEIKKAKEFSCGVPMFSKNQGHILHLGLFAWHSRPGQISEQMCWETSEGEGYELRVACTLNAIS